MTSPNPNPNHNLSPVPQPNFCPVLSPLDLPNHWFHPLWYFQNHKVERNNFFLFLSIFFFSKENFDHVWKIESTAPESSDSHIPASQLLISYLLNPPPPTFSNPPPHCEASTRHHISSINTSVLSWKDKSFKTYIVTKPCAHLKTTVPSQNPIFPVGSQMFAYS